MTREQSYEAAVALLATVNPEQAARVVRSASYFARGPNTYQLREHEKHSDGFWYLRNSPPHDFSDLLGEVRVGRDGVMTLMFVRE